MNTSRITAAVFLSLLLCLLLSAGVVSAQTGQSDWYTEDSFRSVFVTAEEIIGSDDTGISAGVQLYDPADFAPDNIREIRIVSVNGIAANSSNVDQLQGYRNGFLRVVSAEGEVYHLAGAEPLVEGHTLKINEYGYIEGTNGTNSADGLAGNNYTTSKPTDCWVLLDARADGEVQIYTYSGTVNADSAQILEDVTVYCADGLYVLSAGENTVVPSFFLPEVKYYVYSESLNNYNNNFYPGTNGYQYSVYMTDIRTNAVEVVSVSPEGGLSYNQIQNAFLDGYVYKVLDGTIESDAICGLPYAEGIAEAAAYYNSVSANDRSASRRFTVSGDELTAKENELELGAAQHILDTVAAEMVKQMYPQMVSDPQFIRNFYASVKMIALQDAQAALGSPLLSVTGDTLTRESKINTLLAGMDGVTVYYTVQEDGTAVAWIVEGIADESVSTFMLRAGSAESLGLITFAETEGLTLPQSIRRTEYSYFAFPYAEGKTVYIADAYFADDPSKKVDYSVTPYGYVTLYGAEAGDVCFTWGAADSVLVHGFSSVPTVSVHNSVQYQYLHFTPAADGTVYFYYTSDKTVPDVTEFRSVYSADSTKYAANTPARGGQTMSAPLFSHMCVSQYPYVALMAEDAAGNACAPMVIAAPPMITAAYTLYSSQMHQAEFAVNRNGRMYCCLTDDISDIRAEEIIRQAVLGSESAEILCEYRDAAAFTAECIAFNFDLSAEIPRYAVLLFEDEDGFVHAPVILPTDGSAGSSAGTTGFNGTPSVIQNENGLYEISVSASQAGTVYYYYLSNATDPSYPSYPVYPTTPTDSLSFILAAQASSCGIQSFRIGVGTNSIPVPASAESTSIVLMMQSSTGIQYKPVSLALYGDSVYEAYLMPTSSVYLLGASAQPIRLQTSSGASVSCQWYENDTCSNIGGTAIFGATSDSYTPSTTELGVKYYYALLTDTATSMQTVTAPVSVQVFLPAAACGDDLTWELTFDGTLTISGTGAMWDFSPDAPAPWDAYKANIRLVNVTNGCTSLGSNAFSGCTALTRITLPNTLTSIGDSAFYGCSSLQKILIGEAITSIGANAFGGGSAVTIFGVSGSAAENYAAVNRIPFSSLHRFAKLIYTENGTSFKLMYSADYKNALTAEGIADAVTAYTWTGIRPADIADGACILYTADTAAKTIHVQEILSERSHESDDTYKISTYIRGMDFAADTLSVNGNTVYGLGHDILPDAPIRTGRYGGTAANMANNMQMLRPFMNTYCDLYIVDGYVVYIEANPGLNEFVVVEAVAAFPEEGIVVNAYSTLTDSYEEIVLKEFNGWSMGGFDYHQYFLSNLWGNGDYSNVLPFNLHEFYRVVYIGEDGGYNITNAVPLAQSHTIAGNEYGYITGTNGETLGDALSVAASAEDTWLLTDNRIDKQEKTYFYRGKMPAAEFKNVRVFCVSDHTYVLEAGADTVIPDIPWYSKPVSVWNGTAASAFAGGTGTEEDPYLIATAEQLAYLASSVNSGESYEGKYFKQIADIYLNDTAAEDWTGTARKWTPIGTESTPFRGNFDGDGNTVYGLYIYALEGTTVWYGYQGLFGYTHNAVLKNICIDTADLTGASCIGALVGYAEYETTGTAEYAISGCSVKNVRVAGEYSIGGMAGCVYAYASGNYQQNATLSVSLTNCAAENCTVLGETYVGGIVGAVRSENTYSYAAVKLSLSGCKNTDGSVRATIDGHAGGIVGYCNSSSATFTDCTNSGEVTASSNSSYVGGIAGYCYSSAAFTDCTNSGEVTASSNSSYVGGIAGYCNSSSATFTDCTNSGDVSASSYAGGIVGYCYYHSSYSVTFTDCTNSGDVSGNGISYYANRVIHCSNTGKVSGCGIVYQLSAGGTIAYCYNTGEVGGSGIVGIVEEGSTVEYCYNTGSNPVPNSAYSGASKRGGIAGSLTSSTVRNCFNTGTFYGNEYVGGIVGYAYGGEIKVESYILNCCNLGCVNGMAYNYNTPASHIGAVAGWANPFTKLENCYYLENCAIDPTGTVQGGIGASDCTAPAADKAGQTAALSAAQMQDRANFAGFDFSSVWTVYGNASYPYPELITPALMAAPVITMPVTLTEIVTPASVAGIPYGTRWDKGYNTTSADILHDFLPAAVVLKLSDGSTREVPVTWTCGDYVQNPTDKMQPYSYAAAGTLTLPAGIANPDKLPLNTAIAFTVDAFVLSVSMVGTPQTVTALNGTAFADLPLPATVQVVYNDDTRPYLPVTWTVPDSSVYDPSLDTIQTFTVYGRITLPEGVQDPSSLADKAAVSVTVQAKRYYTLGSINYPDSGSFASGTPVAEFHLPATVSLYCSSIGYVDMKVTWDTASCGYDPASREEQVLAIKGSIELPDYILDPNCLADKIVFTATVKAMPYVRSVNTASSVYDVLNGTRLEDMELPETVYISLSSGSSKQASVEWDLDREYEYDPKIKVPQSFTVYGTVILPDGVYNKNNIPLATSCSVYVDAAAEVYLSDILFNTSYFVMENGAELSTLPLPEEAEIRLNTWVLMKAPIVWDLENCTYDKSKIESQNFTITGQVQLPANVPNLANISTMVEINVVVKAALYVQRIAFYSSQLILENGVDLSTIDLPKEADVILSTGDGVKAPIVWDLENCTYDKSSTSVQIFSIFGQVQLPENIPNLQNIPTSVEVSVYVSAAYGKQLLGLVAPLVIYDIPNGTELADVELPETLSVQIIDNSSLNGMQTISLPITWDLASVDYDPTNPHMQHVAVNGTIELPEDVLNPNNISSTVTIHLWFDASTESGTNVSALPKPNTVVWENGSVSWSAVENAQGYEVTLYSVIDDGLEVRLTVTADETVYDFSSVLGTDTYMATVIALGDGVHYSNSVAAYSKFYTPVPLISAVPPAITAQPLSASYVLGSRAVPLTVEAFSPEGVVSYQWYESPDGTTDMGMPLDNPSEDPSRYIPDISAVGTRYYYVVVTCTNDAATGEKTAETISDVVAVTVTNSTGYSISGTVSSFGEGDVTVQLVQDGVVRYETTASSDGTYSITGVAAGEYILRVSKDRHVSREYTVVIGRNNGAERTGL